MFSVYKIHDKIKKTSYSRLVSDMFGHLMFQFSMEYQSNLLILILTFISFAVHILFNCVVKTDLVSVSKANVPYSYQDIINNKSIDITIINDVHIFMQKKVLKDL